MSLEQTACEGQITETMTNINKRQLLENNQSCLVDLKAFERRLTEVIACLQPSTNRWRVVLAVISICTAVGAWYWLTDPTTPVVSLAQSLWSHPYFTISSIILILLFMMGIHKRVMAPSIITSRTRTILGDFNMSCDDTGKLILKPRPNAT